MRKIYPRSNLPDNPIHKLQWQLTDLAIKAGKDLPDNEKARVLLDKALHSDQYWWASHNPYWHYQMVIRGSDMLRDVIRQSKNSSDSEKQQAERLQAEINSLSLTLFGDTVIDKI